MALLLDFYIFLKPSDDARQVCIIIRDNFKQFTDTLRYKSITFDIGSFAHFPTGGAVNGMPIPDRGTPTIELTFVYASLYPKKCRRPIVF